VFVLLESPSPSRRIFIDSHSLPPSLVRHIGPSRRPRTPSPEAARRPKPRSSLGCPRPATCWPDAHRSAQRSVRGLPPSCTVLQLERHPVVTAGQARGLLKASLPPRGRAPSRWPPLPCSRRARPSTSASSRPTTFSPSIGLVNAQALTRCPAKRLPSPSPKPPRLPPPAVAARPRQSCLRSNPASPAP
jgi:hypothetical protein